MTSRISQQLCLAAVLVGTLLSLFSCSGPVSPTRSGGSVGDQAGHELHATVAGQRDAAKDSDKGYIDGWFDGDTVELYYTKTFFCAEPPDSAADTHCELGADAEEAPRPGPIPTLYAIAWTGGASGIFPDVSTLACKPGSTCLNHPAMIDISRVRPDVTVGPGLPHSHIVTTRHAGWFNTVNVRVSNLDVWNDIAAAKTLDKVREFQAKPALVQSGAISLDTPTNIYFFIASWR